MKHWISTLILIMTIIAGIQAQQNIRWRGSGMWGTGSKYNLMFDNFNIQSFSGKITKIDTLTPIRDMSYGIIIVVKSDTDEKVVHLGPGWYIMRQDMNLGLGNTVEVRGATASLGGKQFIMAVEVINKDKILLLRDKDGIPYWVSYRKKL